MEVTAVDVHLVPSDAALSGYGLNGYLVVRVHTDAGVVGVGEAGTWAYLEATATAVETFGRYLVGEDPLRRAHHLDYCYRNAHFRGGVLRGALSALDVALHDIAGKHHGLPVYDLLGGRVRDRVRVYVHAFGETVDDLAGECAAAVDDGFTAVGHLSPLLDEPRDEPYDETHAARQARAEARVERFRDAVGTDADLLLELHRRLDPKEAVPLCRRLERFDPLFYEDPVRPDDLDATARVARATSVPVATGERLTHPAEFGALLRRDAAEYLRPNLGLVGGFTGARTVAALAEARYAAVVPHNPLGPVMTAAVLQFAAGTPNVPLVEYPYRPRLGAAPRADLLVDGFDREGGHLLVPDGPGLGITLDESVLEQPYEPRAIETRLGADGSVVDQ
jgi:L-alanine-DL-glutamate epimerase and related enzymes of enolase superfamily